MAVPDDLPGFGFDRASLETAITARIGDEAIGPLALQIADELHLNARKDVEDAGYRYALFEERLRVPPSRRTGNATRRRKRT